MTIKGDLAAALVSRGMTWEEAETTLRYIFQHATSPDFAFRYAEEGGNESDYWSVITFLMRMI